MVTPFITDMGEKVKMTRQDTGEVTELCRYAYWKDLGRGKPEVHECSDDLEYLKRKYNVPDAHVVSMSKYKKPPLSEKKIMNRESFRELIKECWDEVQNELNPKSVLKESLRRVVRDVLTEIASVTTPEPDKDEKEKISKGYDKELNQRDENTNDKKLEELETIVHGIDPTWKAYLDDNNQFIVRAHNLLYVRIVQKFDNNYDVDAMVRLVDRVRAIALTWDQVKKFIKANFGDLKGKTGNKTMADRHNARSVDNAKAKPENDGKMAGPDSSVKNRGEKNNGEDSKLKTTPKADKDYKDDEVKDEKDLPDQPMRPTKGDELNKNIEKTPKVKPPKHDKSPTELRPADKKTAKFRKRRDQ